LIVAAVCDRRKRRSQSAATVKILKMMHYLVDWQRRSLKRLEREPSRLAAGGSGGTFKIHRLPSSSNALRTETVRAPANYFHPRLSPRASVDKTGAMIHHRRVRDQS
jgi:hypothetical protein